MLVRFAPRECHPIVPRSPGEGTSERVVRADKGGGWRWWDGLKTLGRRLHESFLQCQIDGMWACGRRARWRRALRRGSRGLSSQTSGIASAEIAPIAVNCLLREWGIGIREEDVAISAGRATSSSMRSPTKRRRYDGHVDEPVEDAEEVSPSESAPDDQSASDGETRSAHAADLSPLLTRAMTVDMDLIPLVDVDLPDPQARLRSPRSTDSAAQPPRCRLRHH